MALDLTAEQKSVGRENFDKASKDLSRRGFMKSMAAGAGAVGVGAGAAIFGYKTVEGKPVKTALIGCGDEGGVLLGEHNPDYLQFIAAVDVRPWNKKRIIEGDAKVALRKGFTKVYGEKYANDIRDKHFYVNYMDMLKAEPDLEAVVIALPLHLHAKCAIDCMKYGKERGKPIHVLCEKLMARTIGECKEMIQVARDTGSILSIGHQRHYSVLYAQANDLVQSGVLGEIKHIRALWHRNFTRPWEADPKEPALLEPQQTPMFRDGWTPPIFKMDAESKEVQAILGKAADELAKDPNAGYKDIYELIRWRLYERTGGGLMAELGSHQLDACSIFLGKAKPLSVSGSGTISFFDRMLPGKRRNPREIDDHVFVTYEFPGFTHPMHPSMKGKAGGNMDDIVVVTYSSVSTNDLEAYGECLMGSRGSLIVEGEQKAYLYASGAAAKSTAASVASVGAGAPAMAAGSTWGGPPPAAAASSGMGAADAPISRGYREEMEDFAYCIRQLPAGANPYDVDGEGKFKTRMPRCHGEVAMADAILALTANISMKEKRRIEFVSDWFDYSKKDAVPEKAKG